jgi:lipoprotein-anchoring transpeptidase ErfK/SrfK
MNGVAVQAQALSNKLNSLIAAAATAPNPGGCLQNVPPKMIVVHLVTQQLIAYDHGCVYLRTPVTTGRPALPTGRGTFKIFYKSPRYLMHSPWPPGSPYWYPDAWVGAAMEFIGDGTFLHTADWEPTWAYGAGSEYGPYASHGCVHVMDGPAWNLYSWAPIGTTVVVES